MNREDFVLLSHKRWSDQISSDESKALDQLLTIDSYQNLYDELYKVWSHADHNASIKTYDSKLAFESFKRQNADYPTSDNKKSNNLRWYSVIASVAAIGLLFFYFMNSNSLNQSVSLGQNTIAVADGTLIHLEGTSTAIYSESDNHREINLQGTGVFEVAKNTSKPMRIVADDLIVEVTGTTFLVNTKEQVISVLEGSVDVSEGMYRTKLTDRMSIQKVAGSWQAIPFAIMHDSYNPPLTYDNTPLSKVLSDLEVKFGVTFKVLGGNDYTKCSFTSKDLSRESFDNILLILESTFSAEITTISDKVYQVRRVSCR